MRMKNMCRKRRKVTNKSGEMEHESLIVTGLGKNDLAILLQNFVNISDLELYKLRKGGAPKDDPMFTLKTPDLRDFLTIINLPFFNSRPNFPFYLSTDAYMSYPCVRELMPYNYF